MTIHRAPSAEDIIWKNVGWSNRDRCLANTLLLVTHSVASVIITQIALGLLYFKNLPTFNQNAGYWKHMVANYGPSVILYILFYIMKRAITKSLEMNFSLTRSGNVYWTIQLSSLFKTLSFTVLVQKTSASYQNHEFKGEDPVEQATRIILNYLLMRLVLEPLSTLVTLSDVYNYLKKAIILLKSWTKRRRGAEADKVLKTQEELNTIFEKKEVRIAESITKLTYLYNVVVILSFLYPVGVFIYLLYIIVQSTAEKWVMVRRYMPPKFQYSQRYGRDIAKILHDLTAGYMIAQIVFTSPMIVYEFNNFGNFNLSYRLIVQLALYGLWSRTTHVEMSVRSGDDDIEGSKKKLQKLIDSQSVESIGGDEEPAIENTNRNGTNHQASEERVGVLGGGTGLNTSSDDDVERLNSRNKDKDVSGNERIGRGTEGSGVSEKESNSKESSMGIGNFETESQQTVDINRRLNEVDQRATPNLNTMKGYSEVESLFSEDYELLNPMNWQKSLNE